MIICHSRRFIVFCNPGTGSAPLMRLLAPWQEEVVVPFAARGRDKPFYHLMSPAEAEWTFDARDLAFRNYRRITLVQNPFTRLQALYLRIADTDPVWAMRRRAGLGQPHFCRWVHATRPDGRGAGGRRADRWRMFGSWSAAAWCDGRVTDVLRTEALARELPPLLAELGLNPGAPDLSAPQPQGHWSSTYDTATVQTVAARYADDLARFDYDHPGLALPSAMSKMAAGQ